MNKNFTVIDLTRLGIKPEYTAPEAYALTTRPSELLKIFIDTSTISYNRGCVDTSAGARPTERPPPPRKLHVGSPLFASQMEGKGGFTQNAIFI